MRVHGYCTKCRRIRRVVVSSHGMVRLAMGQMVEGTCDECQQQKEVRKR